MEKIRRNRWKALNLLLVVASLAASVGTFLYLTNVCNDVNSCSYELRNSILRPTMIGLLAIAVILAPFLFLPQHYFRAYIKQMFWWAFIFAFVWVYSTDPNSSHILSPSPEQVARNQGFLWGAAALLFIAFHWWRSRKKVG